MDSVFVICYYASWFLLDDSVGMVIIRVEFFIYFFWGNFVIFVKVQVFEQVGRRVFMLYKQVVCGQFFFSGYQFYFKQQYCIVRDFSGWREGEEERREEFQLGQGLGLISKVGQGVFQFTGFSFFCWGLESGVWDVYRIIQKVFRIFFISY